MKSIGVLFLFAPSLSLVYFPVVPKARNYLNKEEEKIRLQKLCVSLNRHQYICDGLRSSYSERICSKEPEGSGQGEKRDEFGEEMLVYNGE